MYFFVKKKMTTIKWNNKFYTMLLEIQDLKWFSETSSSSMLLKVTTIRTRYAEYSVNCFVFFSFRTFDNSQPKGRELGSWIAKTLETTVCSQERGRSRHKTWKVVGKINNPSITNPQIETIQGFDMLISVLYRCRLIDILMSGVNWTERRKAREALLRTMGKRWTMLVTGIQGEVLL